MPNEHQQALLEIRALKGVPLTLVTTMLVAGCPLTLTQLGTQAGYDPKTVRKHLEFLVSAGHVTPCPDRRWALETGRLRFLRLLAAAAVELADAAEHKDPENEGEILPALSTTTCRVESVKEDSRVGRLNGRRRCDRVSIADGLKTAFKAASIGSNMWAELAAMAHVTPEYVLAQRRRVMNHPDPQKRNVRFLIHCIRSADPVPDLCTHCQQALPDHSPDCYLRYRRQDRAGPDEAP